MTRSPIRDKKKDVITDDGSVIISVAEGEQRQFTVVCGWLTDLTGYTITAKVVEALNFVGDGTEPPIDEAVTPQVVTLPIIDADVGDNTFMFVLPTDLTDGWDTDPKPDDPTYGYIAVQVADTGIGDNQQIFVPIRGLVEVRYNPVRAT